MQVVALWRFPVKSMGGEALDESTVDELGLDGDRRWGVFDVETGTVLTARRTPELLFATARIVDGHLEIAMPDGTTIGVHDANAALSAWLGRDVELRAAGGEGGTYEVPLDFENDAEWVSWTGPAGAWHDSQRSRVSIASIGTMGDWDLRRFRTNIIVDQSGEDAFVDTQVRIGAGSRAVDLDVTKRIDRCVMITRPQPGLDRDIQLLKHINSERASCLAVGALVVRPGRIAVGDVIGLLR